MKFVPLFLSQGADQSRLISDEKDGPIFSRMGAVTGERDDEETTTELIESSTNGDFEKVSSLIAQNPTTEFVNETSSLGETALHMAADRGFLNIVQLLVSKGANTNAQVRQSIPF